MLYKPAQTNQRPAQKDDDYKKLSNKDLVNKFIFNTFKIYIKKAKLVLYERENGLLMFDILYIMFNMCTP